MRGNSSKYGLLDRLPNWPEKTLPINVEKFASHK